MDKLLEYLIGQTWWMVLAAVVYGVCSATYRDLYKHNPSRKRWIGHLTQDTWSTKYRKLLGNTLDWIDARLTPELADKEKNWKPDDARTAWSHGLLNLSLALAIIYQILSLILYWAVTNRDGAIGSLVLIEGGRSIWPRAAVIGLLAACAGSATHALRVDDHKQRVSILATYVLAVVFSLAAAFTIVAAFAGAGAVGVVFIFAGAVAVAFASAVVVAFVFSAAFAFAVAYSAAQEWVGQRTGRRMLAPMVLTAVMFVAAATALHFGKSGKAAASGAILFLAILPLLNVMADFASTGLTRWRLRKGLSGRMWQEMMIDFAGAIAIFFLLGALSILAIHYMRWSDGTALVNLPAFFTDIRANPGHYWWLYFTLFSTLIPTALHGALAVFGTGIHLWPGLRRFIVEGLDAGGKGDAVAGRWAVRALCLSMTISVVAPIFVLGHIVTYHGIVGGWVLDLFEGFAQLVGAIP